MVLMLVMTDRKEMAQALNFGKYPVLTYDLDNEKGSKAIATKKSINYGMMRYRCTLYRGLHTEGDGQFYLLTHASMLSATVGVGDWLESAEFANAPVIESNQEVAILIYSKKRNYAEVQIVKSGKVDPTYSTATQFTEV
jgi:hypothetical protein